jgi:hypothetical protein
MLTRQSTNHELGHSSINARGLVAPASRKSGTKMPGTRGGTIEDWREGAAKGAGKKSVYGTGLRDGKASPIIKN